jgi:uncharacterized protein (DUF1800 family)
MAKSPLSPLSARNWDHRRATHLLNRAGFGVPGDKPNHLVSLGPEAAVCDLVDYDDRPFPFPEPDFLLTGADREQMRAMRPSMTKEERDDLRKQLRRFNRQAIARLTAWWFDRMASTPRPLEEKLTLFWHGHFATSAQKVKSAALNYQLHSAIRRHASGNLKALTTAVGQSPAMLQYLDNARSSRKRPNENWARELMELFTMGQGEYTEKDIKESARAFTGWSNRGQHFVFNRRRHDDGVKTFFGRTGSFTGEDIISIIFDQEATARHFARELWTFFANDGPDPHVINGLAATLRDHDFDLKPMLQQMFLSEAFYSEDAMGAQIKSPAQFLVQLAHDLQLDPPPYRRMGAASASLGQQLFYPPSVKGWDGNRAWINADTILRRYNLPDTLVSAPPFPDQSSDIKLSAMAMTMAEGDAMAAHDQPGELTLSKKVRHALKGYPRPQRSRWMNLLRQAESPEERDQLANDIVRKSDPESAWQPDRLFAQFTFTTATQCIDQVTQRFLSAAISHEQRMMLLNVIGANGEPHRPMTPVSTSSKHRVALLQHIFSMAEYQLC